MAVRRIKMSQNNININWMSTMSVRDDKPIKESEHRTAFLTAYGAIIHSSQFRRLSHKAQVRLNPSFDYVRTRLTHSIEASQIGRQLARVFVSQLKDDTYSVIKVDRTSSFKKDFEDLVATACLVHDIGHPPFGHTGEEKLNELMKSYKLCFDANKQNIHLLLGSKFRTAFDVPYCLVDSIMKYKDIRIF